MKTITLILFIGFSVAGFGQVAPDSTIQLDTITPTELSRKSLSELVIQLQEVNRMKEEIEARVKIIIEAYVDPKEFAGFTPDYKILKK